MTTNQAIGVLLIMFSLTVMCGLIAQNKPSHDFELRLINLEELHNVNSVKGRVYLEHGTVPTSNTTQYTNMPMNKWTEYEHLLGR